MGNAMLLKVQAKDAGKVSAASFLALSKAIEQLGAQHGIRLSVTAPTRAEALREEHSKELLQAVVVGDTALASALTIIPEETPLGKLVRERLTFLRRAKDLATA
jgi:hypothetical protein